MTVMTNSLSMVPVIAVDEDKCVNCHMCIAVCPVKYCIDGSGEKVSINADLCIGCGSCVKACTQKARYILDDAEQFFLAVGRGEKIVAIVAPAVVSSFPGQYRRMLGWLKRLGVAASFDVSFGAELTVKSYVDHIKTNKPLLVIAQPCPAIVSYIEVYRPELLPHLAPSDSPMLHTIKMIQEYYPDYAGYKVLVVSPCAAKKREFQETGIGDYNVTVRSFKDALERRHIDLDRQPEADFDNPPAERAVLFSTPGGLLRTAERDVPGIRENARKIEGPEIVYQYLDSLPESVRQGINPLLVDCLNCDYGCNAGPGTLNQDKSPDMIEHDIEQRSLEARRLYGGPSSSDKAAAKKMHHVLSQYWKPGLYGRTYVDRSANYQLRIPSESQFAVLYTEMLKGSLADHLNCAACGYKSCRGMGIAIFNGLNKKENYHLYRQKVLILEQQVVDDSTTQLHDEILQTKDMVGAITTALGNLADKTATQFSAIEQSAAAVEQMIAGLVNASTIASGKRQQIANLADSAQSGERDMSATMKSIQEAAKDVAGVGEMVDIIRDVSDRTNLLAMNAAIRAAHAGIAGKGFAVVAAEVRKLAETTGSHAEDISASIGSIIEGIKASDALTERTGIGIQKISRDVGTIADEMSALIDSLAEMSAGGKEVTQGIEQLRNVSIEVRSVYSNIASEISEILERIGSIAAISSKTQGTIASMNRA